MHVALVRDRNTRETLTGHFATYTGICVYVINLNFISETFVDIILLLIYIHIRKKNSHIGKTPGF